MSDTMMQVFLRYWRGTEKLEVSRAEDRSSQLTTRSSSQLKGSCVKGQKYERSATSRGSGLADPLTLAQQHNMA
jgi:hypothetical protein